MVVSMTVIETNPRETLGFAIDWLVSDAAGFVTGQQIVVDGGMTVKMIYAH